MMKVKIEGLNGFRSVVAATDIRKGDTVVQCHQSEIQQQQTYQTIQIGRFRHVRNRFLDCMNHSCSPNTVFNIGHLAFVALKHIRSGDEITFFYPGSEIELVRPFVCRCGAPDCLGHIKGGFHLSTEEIENALRHGLCTEFMQRSFHSLLERARLFSIRSEAHVGSSPLLSRAPLPASPDSGFFLSPHGR